MNILKQKNTTESKQLTRSEKFFKRGLPALTGVAALAAAGYFVGQVVTTENSHNASIAAETKKDQLIDDFNKMLDHLATENANPANVIPDSEFSIAGNSEYLGEKAQRTAESIAIDSVDTIADSALAISEANLIHPGSEFVLSSVEINGNDEVIVQLAPTETDDK